MTTRSDNSNCDNQPFIIPLSLHDPLNDDNQMNMNNVFHWINSIEFTRQKKSLSRDFSDASKNINKKLIILVIGIKY